MLICVTDMLMITFSHNPTCTWCKRARVERGSLLKFCRSFVHKNCTVLLCALFAENIIPQYYPVFLTLKIKLMEIQYMKCQVNFLTLKFLIQWAQWQIFLLLFKVWWCLVRETEIVFFNCCRNTNNVSNRCLNTDYI